MPTASYSNFTKSLPVAEIGTNVSRHLVLYARCQNSDSNIISKSINKTPHLAESKLLCYSPNALVKKNKL